MTDDRVRALLQEASRLRYSRRQLLRRASALGIASAAICAAPALNVSARRGSVQSDTLTFWLYRSRLDEFDETRRERIKAWGESSGVEVNIVDIATSDYGTKIPAAIESNTLPDVLELTEEWFQLLLSRGLLADLTDVYNTVDAELGWTPIVKQLSVEADGTIPRVAIATTSTYLVARDDILSEAGFGPPSTYAEMFDFGAQAQDPPNTFGMGTALSNTSDANNWIMSAQAYGVRFADDTGEAAVLGDHKDEAIDWLNLMVDAYEEKRVFPPGVLTWDQTGDNDAFQSERTIFTFNPLSVPAWLKENKPDLLEKTGIHLLPAGPVTSVQPVGTVALAVRKDSPLVAEASDLIHFLFDLDYRREFFQYAQWGPATVPENDFPIFEEFMPVRVEVADAGTPRDFPEVTNSAFNEVKTTFVVPRMIQRVVSDGMSREDSFNEAVQAVQDIYESHAGA